MTVYMLWCVGEKWGQEGGGGGEGEGEEGWVWQSIR